MLRRVLSALLVLSLVLAPLAGAAPLPREVRVLADGTNLRAQPSLAGRVLKQLSKGQVLRVVDDADEWYLVAGQDQIPGYVNKKLVETVARPAAEAAPLPAEAALPVSAPAPPAEASGLPAINHSPLSCVRAEDNPLLFADVTSPKTVQKSRVYFKAHQYPDWYYVDMKASYLPHYLTFLPQPLPETEKVDYYIQAFNAALDTSRTDQYEPAVSHRGCRREEPRGLRVDEREATQLVIGATREGQAPIPPGFSKKGIVAFVTVAGTVLTGAALVSTGGTAAATGMAAGASGTGSGTTAAVGAAGAGGGGISGTTLALIGAGVAAAGAGVAVAAGGGGTSAPVPAPLVTGNLAGSTQPWSETFSYYNGIGPGLCVGTWTWPASSLQVTLTDGSGQATLLVPWTNPVFVPASPNCGAGSDLGGTITFQLAVSGATVTAAGFTAGRTFTMQATRDATTLRGTIAWSPFTHQDRDQSTWGGGQQPFTVSKQ